jgi:hypothetical protein
MHTQSLWRKKNASAKLLLAELDFEEKKVPVSRTKRLIRPIKEDSE